MSKRDLLRKLSSIRHAERGIVPDAAWVSRKRLQIVEVAKRDLAAGVSFRRVNAQGNRPVLVARLVQLMRAPALATISIIATVFGGSLISVSASDRSVPGDFLYPIKLAGEQTRLALTSDKADRLRLKTEFVDRRVDEIKTIAAAPDATSGDRLRQAAQVLKRDLDTVKNQLKEVKQENSVPEAAEVAKLVDQKSDSVAQELKLVKDSVPQDVKSSMAEAEAAAVHTGVSAMEVLIDAQSSPEGQAVISSEDVTKSIEHKVQGIQDALNTTAERVSSASSTLSISDASSSVDQINSASTTLQEVRALLGANQLGQVTNKLNEAAKAAAQADVSVDLGSSSSTTQTPIPVPTSSSSTPPIPTSASTSTSDTTATSTPPTATSIQP